MTTSVASCASAYASALNKLERMRSYMKMTSEWKTPFGIKTRVDWHEGSATVGYNEVSEEVEKLVSERMEELLDLAMRVQEIAVSRLAIDLRSAQEAAKEGLMRAGDVS